MEQSKTQTGTSLTNATASNSTNRPSQSLGIAGDVRPPENEDSVPTVEELQQLLTKQNWLLARITNEKEPLTTTEKQEVMETLSRLTQLVNAGQKELGTTTDSHQPTIREPIPSTTSNLSPSEVVKQMKTKQPTPMWSFGSSSIGVLRNVPPGDLNSITTTPSTTTATTSSTTTVTPESSTLNGRVMWGTNINGAAPTIASTSTATPSTTSPTTTTTVFGSSTFGGSTQPLGFGSVSGTTEPTNGWTQTDQPFTTNWITPTAASSSSSTTPNALALDFSSLGGLSDPFGGMNSSSSSMMKVLFSNSFHPSTSSSSSSGTPETWDWLQASSTASQYVRIRTFKTPTNWTPCFLSTDSSRDNAAAFSKWQYDEWHEPIVAPVHVLDQDHPSPATSPSTIAAASSAPELTHNDLCEHEFHRFILRLFQFHRDNESTFMLKTVRTPTPFIQTHLIQLLYQLADRSAQCYLTIMHESHQHSTTTISLTEWLMDQPMKNPIFHYSHQQAATVEDVFNRHDGNWNRATRITRNLVQRWIRRFQAILPGDLSDSSSTSSNTNWVNEESIHLCLASFVQGVLECFVHQLSLMSRRTYSVVDLWAFLTQTPTFSEAWRGLRCEFTLNPSPPTWIPLRTYQQHMPPLDTYEPAFNIEHSWIQEHINKMNASSWYMEPKKLATYAEQFALGVSRECPLSRNLRVLGVRPLQFWLVSFPTSESYRKSIEVFGYVSFVLTDSIGQEFRLLYGRDHSKMAHSNLLWNYETDEVLCQAHDHEGPRGAPIPIRLGGQSESFVRKVRLDRTPLEEEYYQHLIQQEKIQQQFRERFQQAKEAADHERAQTPLHQLTKYQPFTFQTIPSPTSPETRAFQWTWEKLERIFAEIQPITQFSLFGPTLYEDNRPLKVKREFHSHFMDACLIADGLAPLPKVLNELISDYYIIPIPFIPQEAEEQMRPYQLSPEQPYKGHRLNPVETSHLIRELGPGRFFRTASQPSGPTSSSIFFN